MLESVPDPEHLMYRLTAACALALLVPGCSSSSDNTSGGSAPITATVNGTAFVGNTDAIATQLSGVLNISAFNAAKSAEILITLHVNGPGTYSLASASVGIAEYEVTTTTSASQWETGFNGGTGTITVTTLTASGASGTFSFTGQPLTATGATGTANVTNGSFQVTF